MAAMTLLLRGAAATTTRRTLATAAPVRAHAPPAPAGVPHVPRRVHVCTWVGDTADAVPGGAVDVHADQDTQGVGPRD
jgi:hypothetical protein